MRPPDGDLGSRVSTGARAADCVQGRAQPHPQRPPHLGASPLTCARMFVFLPPSPVCGALGADSADLMAVVLSSPFFSPASPARAVTADCGIGEGVEAGCFHVYCVSGTCHGGRAAQRTQHPTSPFTYPLHLTCLLPCDAPHPMAGLCNRCLQAGATAGYCPGGRSSGRLMRDHVPLGQEDGMSKNKSAADTATDAAADTAPPSSSEQVAAPRPVKKATLQPSVASRDGYYFKMANGRIQGPLSADKFEWYGGSSARYRWQVLCCAYVC